jgi:guanylate kinase
VLKEFSNHFLWSVSDTSRQKGNGEEDGIHYNFKKVHEFKHRIENDFYLEWEEVYEDQYYGTPLSNLQNAIADSKKLLMDIDVVGAIKLKERFDEFVHVFFIHPGSKERAEYRLISRGRESGEQIQKRMKKFEIEENLADRNRKLIDSYLYNAGNSDSDFDIFLKGTGCNGNNGVYGIIQNLCKEIGDLQISDLKGI